jgi:hypothetical protein
MEILISEELLRKMRETRIWWFFGGWCAGIITALLVFVMVNLEAGACGNLPPHAPIVRQN